MFERKRKQRQSGINPETLELVNNSTSYSLMIELFNGIIGELNQLFCNEKSSLIISISKAIGQCNRDCFLYICLEQRMPIIQALKKNANSSTDFISHSKAKNTRNMKVRYAFQQASWLMSSNYKRFLFESTINNKRLCVNYNTIIQFLDCQENLFYLSSFG